MSEKSEDQVGSDEELLQRVLSHARSSCGDVLEEYEIVYLNQIERDFLEDPSDYRSRFG